jgi:hypothetical protein
MEPKDSNPDFIHAIDSRHVWWPDLRLAMGSSASAADRDSASGMVSSLVTSALFTDSADRGAGSAVPDIQPASADCNGWPPARPQPQQRRGRG